ncbi:MAG: transcriptional regulator [Spirochaetes bacterium]|nr:transcriptional regulator [Spirochaetota bacterium]MBU0956234.1 transcriptional regulator [Spirochaetota bacterium]
MGDEYLSMKARDDFNKAKTRATIASILNALTPRKQTLLSLQDVRQLLKPANETYKGMRVVELEKIIGSEGRYNDFSKEFFPRYEHLRKRWEGIDKAHLKSVILPPIKLYQIGEVFFVRDGNHRVSVAKMQGVRNIDAEVIELTSEIPVTEDMGVDDLVRAVIEYEKKRVYAETEIGEIIPQDVLEFTEPGRYIEILRHIQGHKYFINMDLEEEMSFVDACRSWYENIYLPIVEIIDKENYLTRFPGRTKGDLYMWIVKHWDSLKKKYGNSFSVKSAADDYSRQFGMSMGAQFRSFIKLWLRAIFK